ncbi:hypothetical protein [Photobacterium sp. GSS17]|uniref:hypothetical protein n=1 Tax=Photobacterium sp. GSS17 TaxID=3020715 RepID=UPI00235EBD49|nr:hypothetical protein [Photobacterium sp. GSS17]
MRMNKITLALTACCLSYASQGLASGSEYDSGDNSSYDKSSYEKSSYGNGGGHSTTYTESMTTTYNGKTTTTYYETTSDGSDDYSDDDSAKRLALRVAGKGYMYEKEVPDYDGDKKPDSAYCFDLEVKEIISGDVIGSATECWSEVTSEGDGSKLIGTTFLYLSGGLVVTRGQTTVQPVLQETKTYDGYTITHFTGASNDKNGIIKTSGDYAWNKGSVRASCLVDRSEYYESVGDGIYFDCLLVLDLKKFQPKYPYDWYRHHYYKDGQYHDKYDDSSDDQYGDDKYSDKYDDSSDDQYGDDKYSDKYDDSSDDKYGDDKYSDKYDDSSDDQYGDDKYSGKYDNSSDDSSGGKYDNKGKGKSDDKYKGSKS